MKFNTAVDAKAHDEFVKQSPLNHLLQSSTWAEVKDNWASQIVGVTDDAGNLIASSLVLIKNYHLALPCSIHHVDQSWITKMLSWCRSFSTN